MVSQMSFIRYRQFVEGKLYNVETTPSRSGDCIYNSLSLPPPLSYTSSPFLHLLPFPTPPPLSYTSSPFLHLLPFPTPPLSYTSSPFLHLLPFPTPPPLSYTSSPFLHLLPFPTPPPLSYTSSPFLHLLPFPTPTLQHSSWLTTVPRVLCLLWPVLTLQSKLSSHLPAD